MASVSPADNVKARRDIRHDAKPYPGIDIKMIVMIFTVTESIGTIGKGLVTNNHVNRAKLSNRAVDLVSYAAANIAQFKKSIIT